MYFLYNLFITLLSPIWVPWMLWRTWRRKEMPNWQERFGNVPFEGKNAGPRIWFHAVSVGEVIAATPLLKEIKSLLPEYQIILSVTTSSGHQTARELSPKYFDSLIYFPIDVARFQLIAMQKIRPKAVIVMETELWYNFLWAAKVFDAKTFLVNGRISDRSFPRSMKIRPFYHALLHFLDAPLMQTDLDVTRIEALGATNAKAFGSSKFDQAVEGLDANPDELRARYGIPTGVLVIVVGSTRGDLEEKLILTAIKAVWTENLAVIHAPRHLEDVPNLLSNARSIIGDANLVSESPVTRYQIVDSYGALSSLYAIADIAIIGGGFENLGGQNIIQPLAHGKPVLHGPHMQNFRDPTTLADRAGAAISCTNAEELAKELRILLNDPAKRAQMGKAAADVVQQNVGASKRYAQEVARSLS